MKRLGLVFFLSLFGLNLSAGNAAAGIGSACRAAAQSVDYGPRLQIPPDLVKEIGAYRTSWQKACADAGSVSFHSLYAQARAIEQKFDTVIDARMKQPIASEEEAEQIHADLVVTYPGFIPAFEGSFIEYAYFRPSLTVFLGKARTLGDDEDRAFFDTYVALVGPQVLMPWYEMTWDWGGCVKMGEYDWLATLDTVGRLRATLKGVEYVAMLDQFENKFRSHIASYGTNKTLCICRKKHRKDVIPALRAVAGKIKGRPGYEKARAALRKGIAAIKAGRTRIRIEEVQHCSGG